MSLIELQAHILAFDEARREAKINEEELEMRRNDRSSCIETVRTWGFAEEEEEDLNDSTRFGGLLAE